MENKGFRLISYESLEPGEGDEVVFFKNVEGYDDLSFLYLAIKKNMDKLDYTNLDKDNEVPALWDYVDDEIDRVDNYEIKGNNYTNSWERTKKRILSFQKVTQKQKYAFSTGSQPHIYGNKINVNCIVGKNGCGKTTIIEMIVRIMNNLAFALFGTVFRKKGNYHLYYIENIFASLTFAINENEYTINIKGRTIEILQNKQTILVRKIDIKAKYDDGTHQSFDGLRELSEYILFTNIIFNYSIYSYSDWGKIEKYDNKKDEDGFQWCYTDDHPSDILLETDWCAHHNLFNTAGYDIPINLNPRRMNNQYINIPNLNEVSANNLKKLCLYYRINDKGLVEYPLRKIIPNKEFKALRYKNLRNVPSSSHKYVEMWLREYEISLDYKQEVYLQYIEQKTISVARKYYDSQFDNWDSKIMTSNQMESRRSAILQRILNDHSHKTAKIRHTLIHYKFMELGILSTLREVIDLEKVFNISPISENGYREIKYYYKSMYLDSSNYVYLSPTGKTFFTNKELKVHLFDLLPAPIFESELMFVDNNDEKQELRSVTGLSSGERQLLYLQTNLLYHLYNINSNFYNTDSTQMKYKYVNAIFDEVELYLHPEWQRKFVNNLVEGIKLANFENIEGINILISTHSPFILSDVPKSNVMFLDNGKQIPNDQIEYETFGANIHDLLKSGFFMESTIGEFARKQILEIVDKYYEFKEGKYSPNDSDKERYLYIQSIIGDQYYKNTLKFMLEEIYGSKPEDEIERLEREIKEKQERLNQLKGGQ